MIIKLKDYIKLIEEKAEKRRSALLDREEALEKANNALKNFAVIYKAIMKRHEPSSDILALAGTLYIITDILDEHFAAINDTRLSLNETLRIVQKIAYLHEDYEIDIDAEIVGIKE